MSDQGSGGSLSDDQLADQGIIGDYSAPTPPANDGASAQAQADAAAIDAAYGDK